MGFTISNWLMNYEVEKSHDLSSASKRPRKAILLDMINKFLALIIVMVSWVYTYLQTHQIIYIKYAYLFVCQSYLNKVVKK